MAEELLKLENIYKSFGNVKVLKDVNMKIKKGEVVALIGDNGAGKSTLIKVITCLLYTSPSPRDRTRSRMPSSA